MNQEELQKLLLRLQETKNDELQNFLSFILPTVIPLTSNESVRNDVVKVITESLRRAKLASIKLPLDIFIGLLKPQFLPFGCNFAIAFLDGLSDINCISEVHAESISRLIQAWVAFDPFSYQSNSIAAYLMKYNTFIPAALQLLQASSASSELVATATDLLFDYFIDILLYPPSAVGNTNVPAGLSQSRTQRLLLKQKNFNVTTLLTWKLQITEIVHQLVSSEEGLLLEYKVLIGLLSSNDKILLTNNTISNDLQSYGKKLINQGKDLYLKSKLSNNHSFDLSLILYFLMSGLKSLPSSSATINTPSVTRYPQILTKERVKTPKEQQIFIFEYIQKNLDWLPLPDILIMKLFLLEYTNTETSSLNQSEADDRLLKIISHLIVETYERTSSLNENEKGLLLYNEIPSLLGQSKTILSQYAYSSTNHHLTTTTTIVELKNYHYELIYQFIAKCNYPLSELLSFSSTSPSRDLMSLLLTIAITDSSNGNSSLFKLLDAVEERWSPALVSSDSQLEQQIKALGNSPKSSYRLLYIKWIRKLYGWNSFVLSEMWKFTGDKVELVSNFSYKQFQEFKKTIKSFHKNNDNDDTGFNHEILAIYHELLQFLSNIMNDYHSKIFDNKSTYFALNCVAIIHLSFHYDASQSLELPEIVLWQQTKSVNSFLNGRTVEGITASPVFKSFTVSLVNCVEDLLKNDHPVSYQACERHQLHSTMIHKMIDEEESMHLTDLLAFVLWNQLMLVSVSGGVAELSALVPKLSRAFSYRLIGRVAIINSLALLDDSTLLQENSDIYDLTNESSLQREVTDIRGFIAMLSKGLVYRSSALVTSSLAKFQRIINFFSSFVQRWHTLTSISLIEEIAMVEALTAIKFLQQAKKQDHLIADIANLLPEGSIVQHLSQVITGKKSSFASVIAIDCLALFFENQGTVRVFNELFQSQFIENKDKLIYFSIAENISKQLIIHTTNITTLSEDLFLSLGVLEKLENLIGNENKSDEKEAFAVILLVILSNWIHFPSNLHFITLERLLSCIIPFLKENNPFLRDIITLNLIYIYQLTIALNGKGLVIGISEAILTYHTLEEYISQQIVVAITRRKRPAQRVGFDAGGSTSINNGSNQTTNDGEAMNVVGDELLNAVMTNETNEVNNLLRGMISTANSNNANNANPNQASTSTALDAGYSAYEKVCNITKKIGNGAVLMTALSIVKFDLRFGQNETSFIQKIYSSPSFTIPNDKVFDLIPMLYVAKYDPITSIREIMQKVWNQLIGIQEKEKLLQYASIILTYIDKNLLNPLWRERESAGYALENLILLNLPWQTSQPIKQLLPLLLEKGFKLLDDIRESTRKLAISLMKKLLQIILTICNTKENSSEIIAIENMNLIFPILLEKGWISPSIEARGFCLGAIIKILNEESSTVIIPWLERLIDIFIESISAFEPQMLQYMEFHTQSLQVRRDDLEALRIQLSQQSPVHDALKKCLNMIPFELLGNICNIAYHHLSRGVGLATRVAAADAFSYLAEKFPAGMSKYGIRAIQELCRLISERPNLETSFKKSLVNTLGMLAKVVEPSILNNECEELIQNYIKYLKESNIQQYSSISNQELAYAIVIQQILKKAGERLQYSLSLWLYLIGISYSGSFDSDNEVSHVWLDIFMTCLECSGIGNKLSAIEKSFNSSRGGQVTTSTMEKMILYYLNHSSWEKRKQGIRILRDIITQMSVQPLLKELIFTSTSFSLILTSMFSLLPGILWQGQDQLLEGFSLLFPLIPSQYYRWETIPSTEVENAVFILPSNERTVKVCDVTDYPFSLRYMLPTSTTIDSSEKDNNNVKEGNEEDKTDLSQPMEIDSPETTSPTTRTTSHYNVEIYKTIREKILFDSLDELCSSIDQLILGLPPNTPQGSETMKQTNIPTNDSWKINVNALISLFLYELKRGDTNYRVIVGQTLVSLPWKEIQSKNPFIFINHFPTLLSTCELNQVIETASPSTTPSSSAKVTTAEVKKVTHKNTLLFGSRYGAAATATTTKRVAVNKPPSATPETAQPAVPTPIKRTFALPPAVRMHIVDSLSKGWINPQLEGIPSEQQKILTDAIPLIIKNISELYEQEVWSVKRSYLLLLGAIGERSTQLSEEMIGGIVTVIEKSQEENKFTQVKLGGLEALEYILRGENKGIMKSLYSERIKKVLHQAALDTQPLILEFIGKLNHLTL